MKVMIANDDYLVGGNYIEAKYGFSTSTKNRKLKNGELPQPDVPAKTNGASNKWLKSTIDKAFNEYVKKQGVVA